MAEIPSQHDGKGMDMALNAEISVTEPVREILIKVSADEAESAVAWLDSHPNASFSAAPYSMALLRGALCAVRDGRPYGGH